MNASFFLAFLIRFDQTPEFFTVMGIYQHLILPITVIRLALFYAFGLYEWSFRYASLSEAIQLLSAVCASSLMIFACIAFFFFQQYRTMIGRSVLLIDFLICLFLLAASRFSVRGLIKFQQKFRNYFQKLDLNRTLIIGVGDAGELLLREFQKHSYLKYWPVGFLDNDREKRGMRIHGVKVLGALSDLPRVAVKKHIRTVIIVLPRISRDQIQEIIRTCQQLQLACRILPPASLLWSSQIFPLKLRDVDASDLLGREIIQTDPARMQDFFRNKKVLITGGGGSIGSEIAKILSRTQPQELILVDHAENNLYEIQNYFQENPTETVVNYYLCDVKNREDMEKIFDAHRPHIVYHGAAHKHVPLGEQFYKEGILNNVLGTKVTADLACAYGARTFVLISTDKAIRPASIMGSTKRIAELYIQSLKDRGTDFLSVRFGNVLNSRGSVVPLFQKQLQEGSPVTVTDANVTRYFMDLCEAVFLIMEATRLGSDSEIFVLDMGKPIKIVNLARSLAQLMGIAEDQMTLKYIGLRPGEKLEEEIELNSETAIPTQHRKIKIWKSSRQPAPEDLARAIEELFDLVQQGAPKNAVIQKLSEIVPEYRPVSKDFAGPQVLNAPH